MIRKCKFAGIFFDVRTGVLNFGVAVLCAYWHRNQPDLFIAILGGISVDDGNTIDVVGMGRWLLLIAFFLLLATLQFDCLKNVMKFEISRMASFKRWWRLSFLRSQITFFLSFLYCCCVWCAGSVLLYGTIKVETGCLLTFYIHMSMWIAVSSLGNVTTGKNILPGVIIIMEGMLYVGSINWNFPALTGGMYLRIVTAGRVGMLNVYVIEMCVIILCYMMGIFMWKKGYLERWDI